MLKQTLATICIWGVMTSLVQAAPNIVGTFIADVGKSHLSASMKGCGEDKTKAFGHKIILFDNGTFREEIDLNGDDLPDSITSGLWTEARPEKISMIYDGDIAQGAGGAGAWGSLFNSAEGSLRNRCGDGSINFLYATTEVKKLALELNKKRNRAEFVSNIKGYAQGGFTAIGKVSLKANAKGQYVSGN